MPTYSFRDKETLEEFESKMSNVDRESYLLENPQIVQIFKVFPGVVDSARIGLKKPDDGFRDVLKNVQHHHGRNNINTW